MLFTGGGKKTSPDENGLRVGGNPTMTEATKNQNGNSETHQHEKGYTSGREKLRAEMVRNVEREADIH